jgi:hypothetical protein
VAKGRRFCGLGEAVVGFLFVPSFAKFFLCSQARSFEIVFEKNGMRRCLAML